MREEEQKNVSNVPSSSRTSTASALLRIMASAAVLLPLAKVVAMASSSGVMDQGCLDVAQPLSTSVVMHLVDRAGLSRHARDEMMHESTRIWQAGGVSVRWSLDSVRTEVIPVADLTALPENGVGRALQGLGEIVRRPSRTDANVILTREVAEDVLKRGSKWQRPLASILFIDKKPTTLIRGYPLEAERLLESVQLDEQSLAHRPARLRFHLVGRVLGRAIAHELGHFLFASASHAPVGLMRASHRTDHLLAPAGRHFRIVPPQPESCGVIAEARLSPPAR
jgi:hypothetical protein